MRSKVAADAFVAFFFVGALMALAGCQQVRLDPQHTL